VESSEDAIVTTALDGTIETWNPAAVRLYGYPAHEAVGKPVTIIAPPGGAAEVQANAGLLEQNQPVRPYETQRVRSDGHVISVSVTLSALRNARGALVGFSEIVRDISERKRTEEALRASETRFRSLIEHSLDLLTVLDADGRLTYASPSAGPLLGYAPGELHGQVGFGYVHPDDAPRVQAAFARALRSDTGSLREVFRFRHKDGSWRVLESVVTNLLHEPSVAGVVINSRDITDRTRAEEALRRSEAEYRGLVEQAPLGIYRTTLDGHSLKVNRALVVTLGYESADALLQLNAGDFYADPEVRARMVAQVEQRGEARVETQWKRKDASLITVCLNVRLVRDPAGAVEYLEGTVEDVTQQRSLENQFRQAQRLEAVGRLAGGVAHDFNNVLTAITGYSELLLDEFDPGDPKRQDVQEIHAAAQRAAALTRQLLAFSRKQVFQTRVLDLNAVVRMLEKMVQRLVGEDVKLAVSLCAGLGAVRADPGQLEQVILNLAVNSRDAMPGGGRLTIETANADLDETYASEHAGASPGRYIMLAISDTGIGMDAETRSHMFEPFFTTKEQGKGTGLGLATVYGIVKQSGGFVWVYSEPGRGATFKIYLPRVEDVAAVRDAAPSVRPVAGGRETVLVAEDDPSVRDIVVEVLTQKGYHVLQAPDGQTALELARAEPGEIRLLVTDIVMPNMTGRELAETLVAERAGVSVLYMSGYTDDAVVRHGVLEEDLPYLQKPFTPRALATKVREVLDRASVAASR
jgi:two-component system, cell cycle sensor histidine kinase and response regulator CckA